jgi:hypothetical protein
MPYQAPVGIPVIPSTPWYRLTTSLVDVPYIFDFRWNARDLAWYFDLFEIDEKPIVYGVKVVLGVPLARRVKHDLIRCGAFVARDLTRQWRDATYDDFGTRVQLHYYTAQNVIAAARRNVGLG